MDVIAERELKFLAKWTARELTIKVQIGRPFRNDPHPDWTCQIQIVDPETPQSPRKAIGEDSIQALQLAFQLIPALLACYQNEGSLCFSGCAAIGFPGWPELTSSYGDVAGEIVEAMRRENERSER